MNCCQHLCDTFVTNSYLAFPQCHNDQKMPSFYDFLFSRRPFELKIVPNYSNKVALYDLYTYIVWKFHQNIELVKLVTHHVEMMGTKHKHDPEGYHKKNQSFPLKKSRKVEISIHKINHHKRIHMGISQ